MCQKLINFVILMLINVGTNNITKHFSMNKYVTQRFTFFLNFWIINITGICFLLQKLKLYQVYILLEILYKKLQKKKYK